MRAPIITFKKAIFMIFLISAIYWIYLIFSSQMAISCDAASYESLGSLLHEKGWKEYFRTGPNREPLYPFVISFSMQIAGIFSIPYYYIQKIIQALILFFTQLSTLYFLRKLQVDKRIIIFTVAYVGFSPAIVNSAFCLFSEILVLPFVLLIIAVSVFLWRNLTKLNIVKIILYSILFAVLFLLATAVKGIFQYIFLAFILPYLFMIIRYLKNKSRKYVVKFAIFICAAIFIFNLFFVSYKWLNFKHNGKFEFTDRFGELLYGNAEKRAHKLTFRMFLAHLASIPGLGVTETLFSADEARYSGFQGADGFRGGAVNLTNRDCIIATWKVFLAHPFQYIFFMSIESIRMFFWETTRLGFVSYPGWLEKIFIFTPFKNGIRFIASLLTLISFVWLVGELTRNRKMIFDNETKEGEKIQILFFMLLLLISYTGLHSLFSVVTRYSILLAPFYLLSIACFLDGQVEKNRRA